MIVSQESVYPIEETEQAWLQSQIGGNWLIGGLEWVCGQFDFVTWPALFVQWDKMTLVGQSSGISEMH